MILRSNARLVGWKTRIWWRLPNSTHGGTILLGVEEKKRPKGQTGLNRRWMSRRRPRKAEDHRQSSGLHPNRTSHHLRRAIDGKPIYRISIPSGPDKPYCTSGGTYKIRGDGRNLQTQPNELLNIFLDSHGRQFLQRFQDATSDLRQTMDETAETMRMSCGERR